MPFRYIFSAFLVMGTIVSAYSEELKAVPDQVYPDLEYVLSLSQTEADLDPKQLSELVQFIMAVPAKSSGELKKRKGASGAFHAFSIQGNLDHVIDYAYNPNIPIYVTAPSSLRSQEWLTPKVKSALHNLPRKVESADDIRLLRGQDSEAITPDTNTGGYYTYRQDRIVAILPGPTGPVLISASSQIDLSEVGKKGCVVGDDKDWNYLYSGETGLNKTGLGWVDSYMYYADSILIYVTDISSNTINIGSFKWLNAGWARMNMVKSSHILKGIKRFASDFKAVLEAPGLPEAPVLAGKYRELLQSSDQKLRQMVSSYLQALISSGASELSSDPFKSLLSSGEYLKQMNHEEMVKVLLLEHVKEYVGKDPLVRFVSQPTAPLTSDSLN
jgi:hypothetical protein